MAPPLSIYIHWPFCKSKCPYCDFNSHVRDAVPHDRWREALVKELEYQASQLGQRAVMSVFFGGGTPSLMEPATVSTILDAMGRLFGWGVQPEITLETNPTSFEISKFEGFRSAGVNRISVGVQSLRDSALQFLGREHDAQDARQTLIHAAQLFPRVSFDLIYARPGQTLRDWEEELQEALAYVQGHISLYQLTIEENTAFYPLYRAGKLVMPEDTLAADMYQMTQECMEQAGLPAYEISNHAAPGQESAHNLTYWRGGEYVGIGPGAHGRIHTDATWRATENIKSPERWLEAVERQGYGLHRAEILSPKDRVEEKIIMGLRLTEGITLDALEENDIPLEGMINVDAWKQLQTEGLMKTDTARLMATSRGRLLLNQIIARLLVTID